jgi:hypothetical protein
VSCLRGRGVSAGDIDWSDLASIIGAYRCRPHQMHAALKFHFFTKFAQRAHMFPPALALSGL